MSNSLIDLNALSHFKLLQDAYNASTYAAAGSVPTKTSDLTNDSGFITASSLPTVNDATLTITQNGTSVGTFSANASSNVTAAITVPTATSDLTNDSGFITSSDLPTVNNATLTIQKNGTNVQTFTANASSDVTANITVPTVVSDLTNDSGYQTASDVSSAIATAISGITVISFEIVAQLPQEGDPGTIYLISNSGSGTNIYDEFVYVNNTWEQIGTTAADFTNVAYYDSVNNQLSANSSMFWEIATNNDIAGLFS